MADNDLRDELLDRFDDVRFIVADAILFFGHIAASFSDEERLSGAANTLANIQGIVEGGRCEMLDAERYFLLARTSAVSRFGISATSYHSLGFSFAEDLVLRTWEACGSFDLAQSHLYSDWISRVDKRKLRAASWKLSFVGRWGTRPVCRLNELLCDLEVEIGALLELLKVGGDESNERDHPYTKRRYRPPLCEKCGGTTRVTSKQGEIRYLQCKKCGRTDKAVKNPV